LAAHTILAIVEGFLPAGWGASVVAVAFAVVVGADVVALPQAAAKSDTAHSGASVVSSGRRTPGTLVRSVGRFASTTPGPRRLVPRLAQVEVRARTPTDRCGTRRN
jgi:hypothetical protein